ncbi:MAG: hypothetical protein KAR17_17350 [Cyclobacteriaceae bacterium]|nr:hypothetical protein [Cyclobacteriaceae bacterium]
MARPVTREVKLKDGFYLELRQRGEHRGIKIWRESYNQIQMAMARYENMYDVHYVGEVKNGKVIKASKK